MKICTKLELVGFFVIFISLFSFCSLPVKAQTKELEALLSSAKKAAKKNLLQEADSLYSAYVGLYNSEGIEKGYRYCEVLIWLRQRAVAKSQLDRAIELQKEVVEVCKVAKDCNPAQRATAMSDLASLYSSKGNFSEAINIGKDAVEAMRMVYGSKHHYYCITLLNLAGYYSARGQDGDYQKAVEMGEFAVKYMKKGTVEYGNALNSLMVFYMQNGDPIAAGKLSEKIRKHARSFIDISEEGVNYATTLNNQAVRLAKIGNYEEAIECALIARECFEKVGATNILAYSKVLINLGVYYAHLQHFDEAIKVLEQAVPVIEQAATKHHPDYVRCISELSSVYRNAGDLNKAKEYADLSEEISSGLGNVDNIRYAKSLSKQAAVFASNGNYSRAIECEQDAISIFRTRRDSLNMAFSMASLANYFFADGKQEEGLQMMEEALNIYRVQNKKSVHYAQALNNAAILYYRNNDNRKASEYGHDALVMYEEVGDTVNVLYARILANNALFLFMEERLDTALHIAEKALSLNRQLLGEDHPDNIPFLYNLAVYQMKGKQMELAEKNYIEALHLQSVQIKKNFLHLTTKEREKFWKQNRYIYKMAPILAYLEKNSSLMNEEAYNTLLFSKSILLNSDIDFRNLLKNTGNQSLLADYNQLLQLRLSEEAYYKRPVASRNESELNEIQELIYRLERKLVRGCKEYGSFTESLNVTANEIAESLSKSEAAVEFTHFYIHGIGTVYAALVLTHNNPTPRFIKLFTDEELDELEYVQGKGFLQILKSIDGINKVYNDPQFGTLVWKPIIEELQEQGINHIFFSPSAMLHHIGIEYMYCDEEHRIQDLFQVSRLSSTKTLVHRIPAEEIKTVVIYGGLDYDMDLSDLQRRHEQYSAATELQASVDVREVSEDMREDKRAIDSLSIRGAINYLHGTMLELENIAAELKSHGVDVRILQGKDGTEESFKALGGTDLSVIHIATHGFSYSRKEVQQMEQPLAFLNDQTDDLNNPLNYSGLLLAGVNYVLQHKQLPKGVEDGVLTANEISKTDLGNVGLVVLSACQTALGEIKDDGVFGLQRGFKKAGARSLLMSLWKVDDEATGLMMSRFYRGLMEGRSRHEAFALAQQAVRHNFNTSDPYFWASFILLDSF